MQADSLPVRELPCSYWTATPWPGWAEPPLLTCLPASAVEPAPVESPVATLQYVHQVTSMSSSEDLMSRQASSAPMLLLHPQYLMCTFARARHIRPRAAVKRSLHQSATESP